MICGAHGEPETVEVKCVMFGELLMGGADGVREKRVDEASPGGPQSFRYQCRSVSPVDDCSPGRGGMAQDGGTRDGTFHGEMNRCKLGRAELWHAVVCPNVTGRTKDRIAQSKRVHTGSLAMVDNKPQVA